LVYLPNSFTVPRVRGYWLQKRNPHLYWKVGRNGVSASGAVG